MVLLRFHHFAVHNCTCISHDPTQTKQNQPSVSLTQCTSHRNDNNLPLSAARFQTFPAISSSMFLKHPHSKPLCNRVRVWVPS